ncbi:MAG TPA: RsmB/NOP family class I SAM-dependent RNA methyltransferase [Xanthobacteraceae bacterium]
MSKKPSISKKQPARPRLDASPEPPGFAARRLAADILDGVLHRHRALDELLDVGAPPGLTALADRDRALVRHLVATVLRRLGTLRHLLGVLLERGLPRDAPRAETALLIGAAQILWLEVPDHAAVDLAVRLAQADRRTARYAGLVNAVLRRLARDGAKLLAEVDTVMLDTPAWLMERWVANYGTATARAVAAANGLEPPLDLTVRRDPAHWATMLGGRVLPTGTVRTAAHGPVTGLSGYREGAWWVQDAAAALPGRLFGDLAGQAIADLCAAPGGKTAQLAAGGARVVAVDRSPARIERVKANLQRLGLAAEIVAGDILDPDPPPWRTASFDGVLLDAPCSSTGTIRRHPDVPWRKRADDIATLAGLQRALLARAVEWVRPGGVLVYCVCSLEPEEGVEIIGELLSGDSRFRRRPISAAEIGGIAEALTPAGDLRTLPCHLADPDPRMAGLDGFFAARLERI